MVLGLLIVLAGVIGLVLLAGAHGWPVLAGVAAIAVALYLASPGDHRR